MRLLILEAETSHDPTEAIALINANKPALSVHSQFLKMAYDEIETDRLHPEGTFVPIAGRHIRMFADEYGIVGKERSEFIRKIRRVDNEKVRLVNARIAEARERAEKKHAK